MTTRTKNARRRLKRKIAIAALGIQSASAGFIDMDTPLDKRTTTSLVDGTVYHLVMSDEFNTPNRTFTDGHDPVWTALDKPDDDSSSAGGGSQQFYNSSQVTTEDGMLKIKTEIGTTSWQRYDPIEKEWTKSKAYFQSGMLQSWEKFCFTGGIVEVDVILPGDPFIGGLWPAIWILGNLGRATYEASTNSLWPWSYDTCDREKQPAQTISACNSANHFGMNPFQGRGATEIDLIEIMTGESDGPLPETDPPISLPYADMTLQVAPGVEENRPSNGQAPVYENKLAPNGHTQWEANTWYEGVQYGGNTSINPFFYGTYLDETKPGEPVTRTKKQAFQADAVGGAHQLAPDHFKRMHTFRLEWQPGPGGRIDWFSQGYKLNETFAMMGDGKGKDWNHAMSLLDEVLNATMGSQIPIEPSYLIMNTAVSSTWGFPYDVPDTCKKCYDCDDPKCSCTFYPGFCRMIRDDDVAMKIDSIRVYQSRDPDAHVGAHHTLGCDPPDYPTKGWIEGHSYRYMRNEPFSYADKGKPLKRVQTGGGACQTDDDCGGNLTGLNLTAAHEDDGKTNKTVGGRGKCVSTSAFNGFFLASAKSSRVCKCKPGFTGPQCLAQAYIDDSESVFKTRSKTSLFKSIPDFRVTTLMGSLFAGLFVLLLIVNCVTVASRKKNGPNKQGDSEHLVIWT